MSNIISQQRAPRLTATQIRQRLDGLSADQLEAGLTWLARYDEEIFAAVLDAAATWNDGAMRIPASS